MTDHHIHFWNLENLFDVNGSAHRPAWLQDELDNELAGWDATVLDRKIDRLAHIIRQMNNGAGPDLLGVCEVENEPVLQKLVDALAPLNRNYEVVHHDTSDNRGIDVAFIYDGDRFIADDQFGHVVRKRNATRDLFQVNFRSRAHDRRLVIIGNHWPSRSGGQYESAPYRAMAAETLSYWLSRIPEHLGEDTPILLMGDFNDEPFDRSVSEYLLGTHSERKVINAHRAPRMFNLAWRALGEGIGTHYYNNFPNVLDQMLVNKSILQGDGGFSLGNQGRARMQVDMFPDMVSTGYPDPIRHGRPSSASTFDPDGFSDHYPVSIVLSEAD